MPSMSPSPFRHPSAGAVRSSPTSPSDGAGLSSRGRRSVAAHAGRGVLLVAALLGVSACYSYRPTTIESVEPGQPVRLRLSPEAADRLESVRMSDARMMDGVVFGRSGNGLLVDTRVGRLDPALGTRPLNQRVDLGPGEIREIELRERDNLKTGLAIGAAALAAGAVVAAAVRGGGGGERDPGDGPPEDRWIPLVIRLALPF